MALVIAALSALVTAGLAMIVMSAADRSARRLPIHVYRPQAWRGGAARRAATRLQF
jgi:hypothetical protein